MAGYGSSNNPFGAVTDGPNVIVDAFIDYAGFVTRNWRTLQMLLPTQGGWYNIWVS
jgi:hypothetical protein